MDPIFQTHLQFRLGLGPWIIPEVVSDAIEIICITIGIGAPPSKNDHLLLFLNVNPTISGSLCNIFSIL